MLIYALRLPKVFHNRLYNIALSCINPKMEQNVTSTGVWLDFKNDFLWKENIIHNMHFWRGSIPSKETYIIVNIKWSQSCAFFLQFICLKLIIIIMYSLLQDLKSKNFQVFCKCKSNFKTPLRNRWILLPVFYKESIRWGIYQVHRAVCLLVPEILRRKHAYVQTHTHTQLVLTSVRPPNRKRHVHK